MKRIILFFAVLTLLSFSLFKISSADDEESNKIYETNKLYQDGSIYQKNYDRDISRMLKDVLSNQRYIINKLKDMQRDIDSIKRDLRDIKK